MKKDILKSGIILAVAGMFSAACSADLTPSYSEDSTPALTLSVSLSDAQTRTSLGADDGKGNFDVLWSTGDRISVNGVLSNAVAESDNGMEEVEFTVEGNLTAPYRVLYPGSAATNVISLPAVQNYIEDSFDPAAVASYGVATDHSGGYSVSLRNFCGLIRLALNGSADLTRIEVNTLGSEKLYGDFTLETDASGFSGIFTGGTEGMLTYNLGTGLTLSGEDTYVYIALPAQTYADGVEAKVYQADGAFMRLKFWGNGFDLSGSDIVAFESKTYAAGRTENIVSIGGLDAEDGGMPEVAPPGVTVAVFNTLRFNDEHRPSDAIVSTGGSSLSRPANAIVSSCPEMRAAFGKVIYNTRADIIGFNEVGEGMFESGQANSIEDMASAAGCEGYTYRFYSSGIDNNWFWQTEDYKYSNGFAYRGNVLTLEESGRVWLNAKTPGYSATSDSNSGSPKRTCIWARFTHKASGKIFYFFVAQLPTYGQGGNAVMAEGLSRFAADKAGSYPKIFVGDTNSVDHENSDNQAGARKLLEYWSDAYDAVNAAGNLPSFYRSYPGTQSGTAGSYHYSILTFCKNHPERRIDHIMTKDACTATSYRTVRTTYTFGEGDAAVDCYPSDHLAVVSYITLD